MKEINLSKLNFLFLHSSYLVIFVGLSACSLGIMRPLQTINKQVLQSANSYREPALGSDWLVTLASYKGRERIELINLRSKRPVALPGLNRQDAQPISVSVNANGDKIALIQQRGDKTELVLYRRNIGSIQLLEINPKGVPRQVSIDGSGKLLAVQVSRNGRWDIDLIRLQS